MAFGGRGDASGRSAEDRERAAAERAARRAGRPGTVEAPPEEDPPLVEPPPPPRRVPASRRPAPRRPRPPGSRHWGRRILALLALAAIGVALYAINATFQPFHGDGSGGVRVKVPSGADAGQIGDLLEAKGVVDSGTFFVLNATVTGRRGGLRPGSYTLRKGMTNGEAIAALTKGPKAKVVKTTDITIPEGPSIREEAPKIDKTSLTGSYAKAASAPKTLQAIRRLGAPKGTRTAEGFMFPATYTLVEGSPTADLVAKQLAAFKANFGGANLSYARRKNLTRYDVLIIASLIEREAQLDRERPLIASVIYNRLRRGMPLGIDATIRYHTGHWDRPILRSELESDNPYNTRINTGLPPTPIGNPGLASIKAAAKPAHTTYLFFVRKPGKSGAHAFSSSDAQFARDNARYQASRP
jgi:UPF0755 protein